jgi:hypothetical protein
MENQKFQKVPPFFLKIVPEFAKLSLLKVKKKKNSPKKFPQLHPSLKSTLGALEVLFMKFFIK